MQAKGRYESDTQAMTMKQDTPPDLPFMLYADSRGRIFEHPRFRMAGFSGNAPASLEEDDLIPMPEFSKLFFIPDCPPVGLDPETGKYRTVPKVKVNGVTESAMASQRFWSPELCASIFRPWITAQRSTSFPCGPTRPVGFREGGYWAAGFRIEYNAKWDPRHYDDRKLVFCHQKLQEEAWRRSAPGAPFRLCDQQSLLCGKESLSEALGGAPACEPGMQLRMPGVSFPAEGSIVHGLSPKDLLQAHGQRNRLSCGETSQSRERSHCQLWPGLRRRTPDRARIDRGQHPENQREDFQGDDQSEHQRELA